MNPARGTNRIERKAFSVIALLMAAGLTLAGCGKDPSVADNPHRQHYVDATRKLIPGNLPEPILHATFSFVNRNRKADLLLLVDRGERGKAVAIYYNPQGVKLEQTHDEQIVAEAGEEVSSLAMGDFDGDGAADLILILNSEKTARVRLLFNNGKGYFYEKVNYSLPPVRGGIRRVDLMDVDDDRDVDLLFSGPLVRDSEGRPDERQAQLFINNGKGDFRDHSRLLLPIAPPGISGVSYADYDGDSIRDLFLLYGNGQNRLFLNNGLGKFADATRTALPAIKDETVSADWADFDMDGDNDLLVVNRRILDPAPTSGESVYFLENNGSGEFRKRSHPGLPGQPGLNVYLLDANGDTVPDILLLNQGGTVYLQGRGKWRFSNETLRRLPGFHRFAEMAFADVDQDHFLDLFGIENGPRRRGRLWLNRVD